MTDVASKVLVADDDLDALAIMSVTPKGAGFQVSTAVDVTDALNQLRMDACHLDMLDVDMPGLSGYEVCEAQRRGAGELLPIVMVTGKDDVHSIDTSYRAGATDFIAKPIIWAPIAHRVRHLLRGAQLALNLKAAEERIRRLARFDALTGLPNRWHFQHRHDRTLGASKRDGHQLALRCIALDIFRRINDTLGHGAGGRAAAYGGRAASRGLPRGRAGRRRHSCQCRGCTACSYRWRRVHGAAASAGRSGEGWPGRRAHVLAINQPMRLGHHEVLVTPSVGVAVYPTDGLDHETLVKNADLAMYFAKRQVPGTFVCFGPDMNAGALKRPNVEQKLRRLAENADATSTQRFKRLIG